MGQGKSCTFDYTIFEIFFVPAQICHPTPEVSMTPLLVYAIAFGAGFFVFAVVALLAFIITDEN